MLPILCPFRPEDHLTASAAGAHTEAQPPRTLLRGALRVAQVAGVVQQRQELRDRQGQHAQVVGLDAAARRGVGAHRGAGRE